MKIDITPGERRLLRGLVKEYDRVYGDSQTTVWDISQMNYSTKPRAYLKLGVNNLTHEKIYREK